MPMARQIVDAPRFTPLPYGLLSVVQTPPTPDHWMGGVIYRTDCKSAIVTGGSTYDECIVVSGSGGAPPPPPTKLDNLEQRDRAATPFTVYAKFDCSPVGNEDALKKAQDALLRVEPWEVERAFWTGLSANRSVVFPHLAHGFGASEIIDPNSGALLQSVVVTGGGAFKPARALGALEGLLGDCYNGVGVVHIPQYALENFFSAGAPIIRVGGQLQTQLGNLVAVGSGYPGTAPNGAPAAAGTAWIYGTGAVFMYRSAVRAPSVIESFNRAENTIELIAERTYVLGFECCHVGVLVDLT